MAKRQAKPIVNTALENSAEKMRITMNMAQRAAFNSLLRRRDLIQSLLSPGRDVDGECGYPISITKENYKTMYDRTGVATRVVEIWPEECWAQTPFIYEKEEAGATAFEKNWDELEIERHLFHYMNRIDVLSGIGQYGLLLFGIDDGQDLEKPVEGIDLRTGKASRKNKYNLLYLRTYDESVVEISDKETDPKNPRFGYPTKYTIYTEDITYGVTHKIQKKVHWTRVLHVADNRVSSEVFGQPRMQRVYNSLLDLRKILGGSGEMFWRGGFPGIAFELGGDAGLQTVSDTTKETMQENIEDYFAGLDRALLLENVQAKQLDPQVADPSGHIDMQIKAISLALGIPYRVFMGAEQAKVASVQDKRTWNERVMKRQNKYLTPMLVRPFVDRLIAYGALPAPKQYFVEWPDREALTEKDVVDVAAKEVDAMAKYVAGNVALIMSPKDFYTNILKKSPEEAEAFEQGIKEIEDEMMEKLIQPSVDAGGIPEAQAEQEEEERRMAEEGIEGEGTGEPPARAGE